MAEEAADVFDRTKPFPAVFVGPLWFFGIHDRSVRLGQVIVTVLLGGAQVVVASSSA